MHFRAHKKYIFSLIETNYSTVGGKELGQLLDDENNLYFNTKLLWEERLGGGKYT